MHSRRTRAHKLSFKSMTDRQTHKQTKTQRFWSMWRRVKSDPQHIRHDDRGPLAPPKHLGVWCIVLLIRDVEDLRKTRPNSVTSKFFQLLYPETNYKRCKFHKNRARDMPPWDVYIPKFGKFSIKFSVLGVWLVPPPLQRIAPQPQNCPQWGLCCVLCESDAHSSQITWGGLFL